MKKGFMGGITNVVSEDDVQNIHDASVKVLEEIGICSESDIILDIFKKSGAKVDPDKRIILLDRDMIETAIRLAPSSFVFHGREPQYDILLEPGRVYFGMGGSPEPHIWDHGLHQKRTPKKEDVINIARLGHSLDNVDFLGTFCCAGDMPKDTQLYHEYEAFLSNSSKPFPYSAPGREATIRFIEMASIASGGEKELRRRPSIAIFTETVSPLKVGKYSDGTVEAVEFGIPVIVALAPMMGATSPTTLAGTLAQSNAEALFGVVLTQLLKPGAPVMYGPGTGTFDMRTLQYTYASPEQTLSRAVVAQLSRFYQIPAYNLGGAAEAKLPDAEAASQATMGMLLNALSGISMTKVMGTLASGLYGAPEMLIICDEIARMVKRILKGFTVSEETLAFDVIKEVGYYKDFISHEHTGRHFKEEFYFPNLFKRLSIDEWEKAGKKTITEVAHEKYQEVIANSGPVKLPDGAEEELKKVIEK